MRLTIDFETRSACDIKKAGAWRYSEDPSTEVICCAVKADNDLTGIWFPKWSWDLLPENHDLPVLSDHELFTLLRTADTIEAHNAEFEVSEWQNVCVPKYGWPEVPYGKLRCSLAKCSYHALPRGLGAACAALGLPVQKDDEGKKLMLKMCKPRKPTKTDPSPWHQRPEQIVRLAQYCMVDVEAEHGLSQALPDLPALELRIWQLDQLINRRGIYADLPMAAKMLEEVGVLERAAEFRASGLTGGAVRTVKQVSAGLRWLAGHGVHMKSLDRSSVAEALARKDLPEPAREFLQLRKEMGKSSTAKYAAILACAGADSRIRGTLLYHGCSTARWSGRLIQPQNFPRGTFSDLDACLEATAVGGLGFTELFWGDPMTAASTCLRGILRAAPGKELVCADFSSIEARVTAWAAGEEHVLEAFRSGQDLYKITAGLMFNKSDAGVSKVERQIGKTVVLACIAEGELVLTDTGLVPIQFVTTDMRVWDGVEYVPHGGVVCNGEREVFTYDGLTATEDHEVFIEEEGALRTVQFGIAAASGKHIVQSGAGREALRLGGNHISGEALHEGLEQHVRLGAVRELRGNLMDVHAESYIGEEQGVSGVLPTSIGPGMAYEEAVGCEIEMQQRRVERLGELRGARDSVQIQFCSGGGALGAGELRSAQRPGTGPDRQQWALRPGEPAVRHQNGEHKKPAPLQDNPGRRHMGENEIPVLREENLRAFVGRLPKRGDHRSGVQGCAGQAEELAGNTPPPSRARVYDIVNAGPRHRYTVSGKLVHNCGYQGGIGAFVAMARNYGIDLESLPDVVFPSAMPDDIEASRGIAKAYLAEHKGAMSEDAATACDLIKRLWRAAHPNITRLWKALENAALAAVRSPGEVIVYRDVAFRVQGRFLQMRLPSGRKLHYHAPAVLTVTTRWGEDKEMVTAESVNSMTKKWERRPYYGGILTENLVQAISRDLMALAMLRVEAAGYPVVLSVHDELVSEVPEGFGSLEEYERLMAVTPAWAAGLPVSAEGWRGVRYRK